MVHHQTVTIKILNTTDTMQNMKNARGSTQSPGAPARLLQLLVGVREGGLGVRAVRLRVGLDLPEERRDLGTRS